MREDRDMFKNMKLSLKVLVIILALGVIPISVLGTISLINSSSHLTSQVFDQLRGLRDIKKTQIDMFFGERERDLRVLVAFVDWFRKNGNLDKDADQVGKFFEMYIREYEYYDLFLIRPEGDIFYSVERESDFGTNLLNGPYADTGLAKLFRKVLDTGRPGMADFEPYVPSNREPAAFIAQPLLSDGKIVLVVGLQLSIDAINQIMMKRTGMGRTGETYLVGSDNLMRSDSFLDPRYHSIKASFADPGKGSVDTVAIREALAGRSGEKIITDYNGNPVLSAYMPVKIWDTTWALIAEMDVAEAFASINKLTWLISVVAIVGMSAIVAVALLIILIFLNRPKMTSRVSST
jgi:methyl-accepting chemotaxis protein